MFELENETFAIFDGLLDNFGKKYEKCPRIIDQYCTLVWIPNLKLKS